MTQNFDGNDLNDVTYDSEWVSIANYNKDRLDVYTGRTSPRYRIKDNICHVQFSFIVKGGDYSAGALLFGAGSLPNKTNLPVFISQGTKECAVMPDGSLRNLVNITNGTSITIFDEYVID